MEIYINHKGKQIGPYDVERINQLLANGNLTREDAAWHEGLNGWVKLGEIDGISSSKINTPPQFNPQTFGSSDATPNIGQSGLGKLAEDLKTLADSNDNKSVLDKWCRFLFPGPSSPNSEDAPQPSIND